MYGKSTNKTATVKGIDFLSESKLKIVKRKRAIEREADSRYREDMGREKERERETIQVHRAVFGASGEVDTS